MDSSLFSKDDIGKTIQVSDENPEETADLFAYDVYTIVGIADASYYINYQRGSTTLGTGRVSGFVCPGSPSYHGGPSRLTYTPRRTWRRRPEYLVYPAKKEFLL